MALPWLAVLRQMRDRQDGFVDRGGHFNQKLRMTKSYGDQKLRRIRSD